MPCCCHCCSCCCHGSCCIMCSSVHINCCFVTNLPAGCGSYVSITDTAAAQLLLRLKVLQQCRVHGIHCCTVPAQHPAAAAATSHSSITSTYVSSSAELLLLAVWGAWELKVGWDDSHTHQHSSAVMWRPCMRVAVRVAVAFAQRSACRCHVLSQQMACTCQWSQIPIQHSYVESWMGLKLGMQCQPQHVLQLPAPTVELFTAVPEAWQ